MNKGIWRKESELDFLPTGLLFLFSFQKWLPSLKQMGDLMPCKVGLITATPFFC